VLSRVKPRLAFTMAIVEFAVPEFYGAPVQQLICIWRPILETLCGFAGHFKSASDEKSEPGSLSADKVGEPFM
jgi:hypothetical protein